MKGYKFIIYALLGLAIILPGKINLANELVTKDSDYLEGIESRNLSDMWNITEGKYNENPITKYPLLDENINLEIKKDGDSFLIPKFSKDEAEKLDSNYGDQTPTGTTIPFVNF
jgi:hypothetical protein